jgi:hypothetical protein
MADIGVDAGTALECEDGAGGSAIVGAIEADAERGGGSREGTHGSVEEEVQLDVGASEARCEVGREAAVGGSVGEVELDLHVQGIRLRG